MASCQPLHGNQNAAALEFEEAGGEGDVRDFMLECDHFYHFSVLPVHVDAANGPIIYATSPCGRQSENKDLMACQG